MNDDEFKLFRDDYVQFVGEEYQGTNIFYMYNLSQIHHRTGTYYVGDWIELFESAKSAMGKLGQIEFFFEDVNGDVHMKVLPASIARNTSQKLKRDPISHMFIYFLFTA